LEGIWWFLIAAGVVVAIAHVVHGRWRGHDRAKILERSLPAGIPLFVSLPHVIPSSRGIAFVGIVLIVVLMGLSLVRRVRR
jgi:hypothetical protein